MNGRPVWLASVSRRTRAGTIPNTRWTPGQKRRAIGILSRATDSVGDPERWRLFRMNVTYCLHKAVTDTEMGLLPEGWGTELGGALAGGPVEILDSRGVETQPSCLPCENPTRVPLSSYTGVPSTDPDLWFPEDCGLCGPCLGRQEIAAALNLEV